MSDAIVVINGGSSSLKFAVYALAEDAADGLERTYSGQVEGLGHTPRLSVRDAAGAVAEEGAVPLPAESDPYTTALDRLLAWIEDHSGGRHLVAAGHRVVHGGRDYADPVRLSDEIIGRLEGLVALAPLHQPHNLAAIRALARMRPELVQVACFDTAFHRSASALSRAFALPRRWSERGIERYGFHGLSYEYIASVLPELLGADADGRIVVAHLGHGASMCALHRRRSVATTMGFTALDGLPMGRRCGALDPGVVLYLLQTEGMDADAVSDLLYERSGLLGVSGISDDMRELLASPDPRAAEAVALFTYRAGREIGSLAAALGGLDALVFTGGIGEHAAPVRAAICRDTSWLGLELDSGANEAGGPCISRGSSRVAAWVVPTDEERVIARHTACLVSGPGVTAAR